MYGLQQARAKDGKLIMKTHYDNGDDRTACGLDNYYEDLPTTSSTNDITCGNCNRYWYVDLLRSIDQIIKRQTAEAVAKTAAAIMLKDNA